MKRKVKAINNNAKRPRSAISFDAPQIALSNPPVLRLPVMWRTFVEVMLLQARADSSLDSDRFDIFRALALVNKSFFDLYNCLYRDYFSRNFTQASPQLVVCAMKKYRCQSGFEVYQPAAVADLGVTLKNVLSLEACHKILSALQQSEFRSHKKLQLKPNWQRLILLVPLFISYYQSAGNVRQVPCLTVKLLTLLVHQPKLLHQPQIMSLLTLICRNVNLLLLDKAVRKKVDTAMVAVKKNFLVWLLTSKGAISVCNRLQWLFCCLRRMPVSQFKRVDARMSARLLLRIMVQKYERTSYDVQVIRILALLLQRMSLRISPFSVIDRVINPPGVKRYSPRSAQKVILIHHLQSTNSVLRQVEGDDVSRNLSFAQF